MSVYIAQGVFSTLAMWLGWHLDRKATTENHRKNYKLIGTICSGAIVYLVMALRSNQGLDYIHLYVYKWNMYRVGALSGIGSEPLIDGILFLLGKISPNPQLIMAVFSAFVVVPLWIAIYHLSETPHINVALFFLARHVFASMAAFDIEIALSFVALACVFMQRDEFWLYTMFIAIGGLSYYPVLLFIPLYLLKRMKIDSIIWILLTAAVSSVIRLVKIITEADDVKMYIVTSLPMYNSWFLFEALFIAGLLIVIADRLPDDVIKGTERFELNINYICIPVILNASLFGAPETWVIMWSYLNILLLPKLISVIEDKKLRLLVSACLLLVMLYVGYNKIWLGNVFNPLPYQFIFS